jgi:hypothetical protein
VSREIKLRKPGKRAFPDRPTERTPLRLIPSGRIEKPLQHDDELMRLLDELRGRQKPIKSDDEEGPEAA